MTDRPSFAAQYRKEQAELVRQTCLYVATRLGDLLDELVVVGGLVPSLLTPEESVPRGEDMHVGTMDLDLGLSLALLDAERYEELTERLHRAGLEPDVNEAGNPTFQRWKIEPSGRFKVTVDFVIPPSRDEDKGGMIRHIEKDFAAVITPGLHLGFQDRPRVSLMGSTILGEKASRDFSATDGVGPRRVAQFLYAAGSDELQADVAGFVRELLRKCTVSETSPP